MKSATVALSLAVLLAGCDDGELDRDTAAEAIQAHLVALAPNAWAPESADVAVSEILLVDEHAREARFRLVTAGEEPDSSSVYTARFSRADAGWSLAAYGAQMPHLVADIVATERSLPYEPLSDFLEEVESLASQWQMERLDAWTEAIQAGRRGEYRRAYQEYRTGPDEELLRSMVRDSIGDAPDSIAWGVVGDADRRRLLIWARLRSDTTVVCAQPITRDGSIPTEFYWIDDDYDYTPTCRSGPGRTYNMMTAFESVLEEIVSAGGFLHP